MSPCTPRWLQGSSRRTEAELNLAQTRFAPGCLYLIDYASPRLLCVLEARPTTEVIVVTGYGSVQTAVEATKAGAFYFVEKPFDFEELSPLVEKALERRELMAETANMLRQLSTRAEYFNIIGSSKQMQTIYETIESVAKSDANVLIVGESGTGKELIANAIHYNSLRAKKPFSKVNCAALPKELIESELFGHTKGAFTGA